MVGLQHLSSHAEPLNSNRVIELIVSERNDYLWNGCRERKRNRAQPTMVNHDRTSRQQLTERHVIITMNIRRQRSSRPVCVIAG